MRSKRSMLLVLALGTVLFAAQSAEARRIRRAAAPAENVAAAEVVTPEVVTPSASKCCPAPCIKYRHRGPKLCCGPCKPGKSIVLEVKHPCHCCAVEVPICLPACCEGEPTVCAGKGFLCRDVVEYEWCCGYSVRVAFKHHGGLVVTTWGR